MGKCIWKYILEARTSQDVLMPARSQILTAQTNNRNELCIWALVNPQSKEMDARKIEVYATGQDINLAEDLYFIATAQMSGGTLVWHVFERMEG